MPGFVGFPRQVLDFLRADVAFFKFAVDGQQGNDIFNLGIIDDSEAAALAASSRAIGQANFVDGVADAGYSLSGTLIIPEVLEQRAQINMN